MLQRSIGAFGASRMTVRKIDTAGESRQTAGGIPCRAKQDRYNEYKYLGALVATSIRLDPAIEQRLDHLAASTGRTKAYYLRELVARGLEDLEDFYLASATMERVRSGRERVYSLDVVERQLGLAD